MRWVLARRPQGRYTPDLFRLEEEGEFDAPLADGEVEIETRLFLCAPTMRNWMDAPGPNLYPSVPIGSPMLAPAGGRVVASRAESLPVGTDVTFLGSWSSRARVPGAACMPVPGNRSLVDAMGRFGINPLTAWFGVHRIGRPRPGETMLVSGAAGSVGSIAVQLGRLSGARVVGIAGGAEKCDWLLREAGVATAIDYRAGPVREAVAAACPAGVDVFFDNVGGETLDAAVDVINKHGRIILCGQISGYDGAAPRGPANMMRLIYGSVTMTGFLVGDFAADWEEAINDLGDHYGSGALVYRDDLRDGFEGLPAHFGDLFQGGNRGTLMVRTHPGASLPAEGRQ